MEPRRQRWTGANCCADSVRHHPADSSWMRPNRRHIWNGLYLPGVVREGVGEIAIAVDCSGSVNGRLLRLFELRFARSSKANAHSAFTSCTSTPRFTKLKPIKPESRFTSIPLAEEEQTLVRASIGLRNTGFGRKRWSF